MHRETSRAWQATFHSRSAVGRAKFRQLSPNRVSKGFGKRVLEAFAGAFGGTAGEAGKRRMAELLSTYRCRRSGGRNVSAAMPAAGSKTPSRNTRDSHSSDLARGHPRGPPNVMCAADVVAGTPVEVTSRVVV
jgi:hypothetical protein